ncbi:MULTISPECIES: uracil-xanthine permease family protein [Brevibacterium]|uniref:Uracil-xanthine permease n=2 Tax=Brevibacterium casei TaxID=33889 RepID=K9AQD5_9MICO|nr:solute carrier family 23 protein [Brevibacterium casei]SIJ52629.1 uracil-xanthine permease [Mycobacteroides abscessus subsp. abscessus]EKU49658.1 uracil-xanthine permease [Brevibacterium casei S18]KZE16155.1 nitrate reductase [Brevibacterium casei]MCT1551053.1 nitrate reductase [Brevibacterium casei]MCT1561125.1 nitrate reductase [Brevibacterium casei]
MRAEDSIKGWPWRLHGDGKSIRPGEIVLPEERMTWPRTIGIGAQHVVAMFGATFLVPLLTGFPPSTTLFFTAIGALLFLLITKGMMPSYLGSSFGLLAPIGAVTGFAATSGEKLDPSAMALAQGGIISVGVTLALVGIVVHFAGVRWIEVTMPPVVTGSIVALIGLNLAPAAWGWVQQAPLTAVITIAAIIVSSVLFRGMLGRLSILIGVFIGYGAALVQGEVDFSTVETAAWVGLPTFHAPAFDLGYLGLFLPVVLVLVAENIGHVKSVAAMTGRDLDGLTGRALFADGLATTIAGAGGGSGTTTYAENIGVMAATKIYSTAAYLCAAIIALILSLLPKFGEIIATIPPGVLGGAATVLYGMIGLLGVRIWAENRVDFSNPINLNTAAVSLIVAIANYTWSPAGLEFAGIALGTASAIVIYQVMRAIAKWRGTAPIPDSAPEAGQPEVTDRR